MRLLRPDDKLISDNQRRRIGIFGGTFDPPHLAHLLLAHYVIDTLQLDQLVFIPASRHALKENQEMTPAPLRLEMIREAVGGIPDMSVSSIELDRNQVSYTVDTLNELHHEPEFRNSKFYYILGVDNLAEMNRWKDPAKIFRLATVVALARPGISLEAIDTEYVRKSVILDSPLIDISATRIRGMVKDGQSINRLVPGTVADLIRRRRLYR